MTAQKGNDFQFMRFIAAACQWRAARRANWAEYPMVENEGRCCKNFLA